MSIEAVVDQIQECIDSATKARDDLAVPGAELGADEVSRLDWLERQLTARITQMQGLMLDLESGLSPQNLGYESENEVMEVLEDIAAEIQQLRRMIREVKGLSR